MADKTSSHKVVFIIFIIALFFATGVSAQVVMPDYVRIDPAITEMVDAPTGLALDQFGKIYLTESIKNRLLIFSQSGNHEATLTGLYKPMCVSVDNIGRIYICNKDTGSVAVYDSNRVFLFNLGASFGEFTQPNGIDIDHATGNVYVADMGAHVVRVFNPDNPNTPGDPSDSYKFSLDDTPEPGEPARDPFNSPTSVAVDDATGEVIVLDHPLILDSYGVWIEGARIQIFNIDGTYIDGYNKYGSQIGDLVRPVHLTVDSLGRIYVTDSMQNGVFVYKKYKDNSSDDPSLGTIFDQDNPLRNALGIAIGQGNKLYIALMNFRKVERYGIDSYLLMEVLPDSLSFSGQRGDPSPPAQNADISNNGSETLNWTASTAESWIDLPVASGSTLTLASSSLSIGVDMGTLTAGVYNGTVTISSDNNEQEEIAVEFTVTDVPLIANPGGTYNGIEGEAVILDGSNSIGAIDMYKWDIGNNGSFDYENPLPTQSHVFNDSGSFTIKLEVEDDDNNTDFALTFANISDAVPTADFTGSAVSGMAPLTVDFANNSSGHDVPLTYAWYFDDDDIIDSTDVNPSYVFSGVGTHTVKLTVTDSDGSTDTLVRTNYINVTRPYSITPETKDFGQVCIGQTSKQVFTIANEGTDILEIGSINLSGPGIGEFDIQNNNCSGSSVAESGNCIFEVQYEPASVDTLNAVAEVQITSPLAETFQIDLQSEGVTCPDILVSKVLLDEDFSTGMPDGWLVAGQWNSTNQCSQSIASPFVSPWAIVDSTCTAAGGDELSTISFNTEFCTSVRLEFSNLYVGDAGNAFVQVSDDSGSTWANELIMPANVSMTPVTMMADIGSVAGVPGARVRFQYLDGQAGVFWAVDNVLAVCEPTNLVYSAVVLMSSPPQRVIIQNTGSDDLDLGTVEITGADNSQFTLQSNSCGPGISPQDSCEVEVVFEPTSTGVKVADLKIPSNDLDAPEILIPLSGTAVLADSDSDGIANDGDASGFAGDNPCTGGNTVNCDDNCVDVFNPTQADVDGDGVGDACDNCREVANTDQRDTNSDEDDNSEVSGDQHYGNMCDPDFNNDGLVSIIDFNEWRKYAGQDTTPENEDRDINNDGLVWIQDYNVWRQYYNKPPGPGIGD